MKTRMIVIIALVLLMVCQTASATATWAFDREIYIDNIGNPELSDSAVYLDLSDVSPPIREAGLRIVDATNATMPHWHFWVVGDYVKGVWFIASHIPSDTWCNGTYHLKYVNGHADSTSSLPDVRSGFAYADDFEDLWDFDVYAGSGTALDWTFASTKKSHTGSAISNDRVIYANGRGADYGTAMTYGYGTLTRTIPTSSGDIYNIMHKYEASVDSDLYSQNPRLSQGSTVVQTYSTTSGITTANCAFTAGGGASTVLKFQSRGYGAHGDAYANIAVHCIAVQNADFAVNGATVGDETGMLDPRIVPDYFDTIQRAADAICPRYDNQTILVRDGTYTENIVLPAGCNNITIISENGSASTIIEAAEWGSPAISLSSNDNITIEGFTIKDGSYGIAIDSGSSNVTLQNNLLTTNFDAGLYITGSHPDLSITNCTSSYNQDGAVLYNCQQAAIDDLDCTYNYDTGIELQNADYITIDDCTIAYNANNGIELISSSDFNTISNNTIEYNNDYGVAIASGSDYNKIYNNKFTNGANGYDEGLNTWYTTMSEGTNIIGGQFTGGNYYSDYTGEDADHDGIGDTPYEIAGGGGIDMLPLSGIGMWVIFDAPSHLIGDDVTVSYHLTDSAFSTYDYFVEVRDDTNTLLETWSIGYNEDSGEYDFYLKYGWRTGEYTVYLWRTPKAGGGEVLLSQDTLSVGERMFISGVAYDVQNNITLSDVLVTFTQESTEYTDTTDGSGYYEIESLNVDKLTWINVSKTGYTHSNFSMTLLAAMAYEIDLYLLPEEPYRDGNAIGGVVTSFPFHQAIESATVSLENATWGDTITTNIFGFYSFENIVSGTYSISAAKAGYSTYTPDTVSI